MQGKGEISDGTWTERSSDNGHSCGGQFQVHEGRQEDWYKEADWINGQCWFIDAVYSSEPEYDAFFKRAYPSATHVLVDPERKVVPISATKLRMEGDYSKELLRWLI